MPTGSPVLNVRYLTLQINMAVSSRFNPKLMQYGDSSSDPLSNKIVNDYIFINKDNALNFVSVYGLYK